MKTVKLSEKIKEPLSIALGFFDSIHIGHRKIIKSVVDYAKKNNTKSALFTFYNSPYKELDFDKNLIYPYNTRLKILSKLNLDYIITAEFNSAFRNLSDSEFLELLSIYDIKMISCGYDYRYGKNADGNINRLSEFCAGKEIIFNITDDVTIFKNKVSSTTIRTQLGGGYIKSANSYLGAPYRISGLKHDRKIYDCDLYIENEYNYVRIPDGRYKIFFWLKSTKIQTIAYVANFEEYTSCVLMADMSEFDLKGTTTLFFIDRIE